MEITEQDTPDVSNSAFNSHDNSFDHRSSKLKQPRKSVAKGSFDSKQHNDSSMASS
jgi:hypothetical protein